jgi:hypothetical protein
MTRRKQIAFNWGRARVIGHGQIKGGLSVALVDIRKGLRPLSGELWIYVATEPDLDPQNTVKRGEGAKVLAYVDRIDIQGWFKRKGATDGNGTEDGTGGNGHDTPEPGQTKTQGQTEGQSV